ncbi:ribose-5-phosphate isomerase [Ehrlichia ruminantium]|nr:ribose 5-phosphate isomerase B [Ehrlichia ruminantium]UOD98286.1 ribose 5-phosphate isomerase B [Ehrlichia ruminantium]UOD99186.1 ribose 5-phosphate isomerase B [Ehrlichia ruminantium]UOE00105.1 ribose 5-phosphate isomerase B [Ehrlichia ruminantium]CAH58133.1 ribose 5-phosphate isomerase B [Ehrlichia ruminantium str. Welgevonden]GAT76245.1 ribose-5-phosphate isomerase [Ehrlichia ruminantium]
MQKIFISSDHAGVELRLFIKLYLESLSYTVEDYGCVISDVIVDYPDYVQDVVHCVTSNDSGFGILICGTGIGMSIAANRYKKVRAALCYTTELARFAREHNNANVLCLGARYITYEKAKLIVYKFLNTKFAEGRHTQRIEKIDSYL